MAFLIDTDTVDAMNLSAVAVGVWVQSVAFVNRHPDLGAWVPRNELPPEWLLVAHELVNAGLWRIVGDGVHVVPTHLCRYEVCG